MNPIPIIMPVKDRLELTKQTVESLFKETPQPFQLIVVSDGSNNETVNYLKGLGDKIKLVVMPSPAGVAHAKNSAFAIAGEHPFYYVTDNDIYFTPDWLPKMLKAMDVFPKLGILGGRTHPYHGMRESRNTGGVSLHTCNQQSGFSMLIRKQVWFDCGPFLCYGNQALGRDDVAFCDSAWAKGWEVAHLFPEVIYHCGIKNSFGSDTAGVEMEKEQKFPQGVIHQ